MVIIILIVSNNGTEADKLQRSVNLSTIVVKVVIVMVEVMYVFNMN